MDPLDDVAGVGRRLELELLAVDVAALPLVAGGLHPGRAVRALVTGPQHAESLTRTTAAAQQLERRRADLERVELPRLVDQEGAGRRSIAPLHGTAPPSTGRHANAPGTRLQLVPGQQGSPWPGTHSGA